MRALRAVLDASLEIVIALSRFLTIIDVLGVFMCLGWWIWYGDERYLGLSAVALALAGLTGWFGFWLFGNEEWRRGKAVDGAPEVRHH